MNYKLLNKSFNNIFESLLNESKSDFLELVEDSYNTPQVKKLGVQSVEVHQKGDDVIVSCTGSSEDLEYCRPVLRGIAQKFHTLFQIEFVDDEENSIFRVILKDPSDDNDKLPNFEDEPKPVKQNSNRTSGYVVTIVSSDGRLRAQSNDGVNGTHWVAFPNKLRDAEGHQYSVSDLTWNGKNYVAVKPIRDLSTGQLVEGLDADSLRQLDLEKVPQSELNDEQKAVLKYYGLDKEYSSHFTNTPAKPQEKKFSDVNDDEMYKDAEDAESPGKEEEESDFALGLATKVANKLDNKEKDESLFEEAEEKESEDTAKLDELFN